MTARANITGVSAALVLSVLCAHQAQGDGGLVVWSGERLNARGVIVVSPAAPRAGAIEFAWIGSYGEGAFVRATHKDGTTHSSRLRRTTLDGELHATLTLEHAGQWEITLDCDGMASAQTATDAPPVTIVIGVGDALPPWNAVFPALFAWIPLSALALYATHRRRRTLTHLEHVSSKA